MASKKGEQFALFEVDDPEVAPAEPEVPESLQPSLFDIVDDEFPEQAEPEDEADGKTVELAVPGTDAEDVEPHATDPGEGVAAATSLPPAGRALTGTRSSLRQQEHTLRPVKT